MDQTLEVGEPKCFGHLSTQTIICGSGRNLPSQHVATWQPSKPTLGFVSDHLTGRGSLANSAANGRVFLFGLVIWVGKHKTCPILSLRGSSDQVGVKKLVKILINIVNAKLRKIIRSSFLTTTVVCAWSMELRLVRCTRLVHLLYCTYSE